MKLYYFMHESAVAGAHTNYNEAVSAATTYAHKAGLPWVPTIKEIEVTASEPIALPIERHPLDEVFKRCVEQAEKGKGEVKHGLGKGFYDQQWVDVTRRHGVGFLTGQAVKKLNEAAALKNNMTQEDWEKEMHGAINYAAMAVLYRKLYGDK